MPRQIQKPKFDSSEERRGVYDDANSTGDLDSQNRLNLDKQDLQLGTHAGGQAEHARQASKQASNVPGNIDDLLGQEEAPESTTGGGGDGDDKKTKAAGKNELLAGENPLNFTGGGDQKNGVMAKLNSSSKFKKRVIIAGAAASGSIIGGVFVFLAMLPLKIEHVVDNLQNHFAASSESALDTEAQTLVDKYITQKVFPNLGKGTCHSTIDISCNALDSDSDTPVGKLFHSWKQAKFENTLATKYDLAFGKKNGQFFINTNGKNINLKDGQSIFDLADTKQVTQKELRNIVNDRVDKVAFYKKLWTRTKINRLLDNKYGMRQCIITCKINDTYPDKLSDKKLAAKGYIIQRVVTPISEAYGLVLQCIIGGGSVCTQTSPDNKTAVDDSGDQERTSIFQQQLQQQLDSFVSKFGAEKLADVIANANEISDKGFTSFMIGKVAEKLGFSVGTKEAIQSAIPLIGWINFISTSVGQVNHIGPALKALNYAIASAGAVQLYMSYRTVADEMKSGHTDAAELGSFVSTLSDDLQADGKGCDMTDMPLYQSIINGKKGITGNSKCKCNDGGYIPAGKVICDEEHLSGGSRVANAITNATKYIPGWGFISSIADLWNGTIGKLYNLVSGTIGDVGSWLIGHLGLNSVSDSITNLINPFIQAIVKWFLPSPFSANMSGGRIFDMMSAGDDVAENEACQVQLGCAVASDQTVMNIRNQQLENDKSTFEQQSMFARLFDTNSQYSLVSKLATEMPTSLLTATNDGVASLASNPFGKLAGAFSSIFSGSHAFAADDTPEADPFGVTQVAYSKIPSDQETFWKTNCVNGPLGKYDATAGTLDVSDWLDTWKANPETGQAEAQTTNPCLLINTGVQVLGSNFDTTLLPKGSLQTNQTNDTSTQSGGTTTTDAAGLKKQLPANNKMSIFQPFENFMDSLVDFPNRLRLHVGFAS